MCVCTVLSAFWSVAILGGENSPGDDDQVTEKGGEGNVISKIGYSNQEKSGFQN